MKKQILGISIVGMCILVGATVVLLTRSPSFEQTKSELVNMPVSKNGNYNFELADLRVKGLVKAVRSQSSDQKKLEIYRDFTVAMQRLNNIDSSVLLVLSQLDPNTLSESSKSIIQLDVRSIVFQIKVNDSSTLSDEEKASAISILQNWGSGNPIGMISKLMSLDMDSAWHQKLLLTGEPIAKEVGLAEDLENFQFLSLKMGSDWPIRAKFVPSGTEFRSLDRRKKPLIIIFNSRVNWSVHSGYLSLNTTDYEIVMVTPVISEHLLPKVEELNKVGILVAETDQPTEFPFHFKGVPIEIYVYFDSENRVTYFDSGARIRKPLKPAGSN